MNPPQNHSAMAFRSAPAILLLFHHGAGPGGIRLDGLRDPLAILVSRLLITSESERITRG